MTLNAVRSALAARMATITSLRCHDTFPQRLDPPACFIGSMRREPGQTFDQNSTISFEVFVCLSQGDLARQIEVLDGYADVSGTYSIEAALVASPTLGGTASSAVVMNVVSPLTIEVAGQPYVAAQFDIEVFS